MGDGAACPLILAFQRLNPGSLRGIPGTYLGQAAWSLLEGSTYIAERTVSQSQCPQKREGLVPCFQQRARSLCFESSICPHKAGGSGENCTDRASGRFLSVSPKGTCSLTRRAPVLNRLSRAIVRTTQERPVPCFTGRLEGPQPPFPCLYDRECADTAQQAGP